MPPIEIADKILNTDSNNFINEMSSKGFTYIKNSKSLYGNTFFTLGSIFNLKPLEKINEERGDSFDNLKYAGQLVAKSDKITIPKSDDDDDEVFIFNPTQAGFLNAVLRNKICLIIVETNHK